MKKEERTVLAPQQDGDRVQHEVPQVTVSFSGHRLFAPSASFEATRLEVGRRIIRRLAQLALKRIVDLDMKAAELGERKAWLAARLRLVKLAVDGAAGLLEDTVDTRSKMAALERELNETVHDYIETKASVATMASYSGAHQGRAGASRAACEPARHPDAAEPDGHARRWVASGAGQRVHAVRTRHRRGRRRR